MRKDDGCIVVDRNEVPISDLVFKSTPNEVNGFLWAANINDDEYYTVIDFSGKVYADSADEIKNVIDQQYGITKLYNGDKNSLLLYPDGTVAELGDYDGGTYLPYYIRGKEDEPDKIFVLNDGQYREMEEESITSANQDGHLMLIAHASGESDYSLYSIADGSCLLEKGGSRILSTDDWVYALKDGVWEIYKVSVDY